MVILNQLRIRRVRKERGLKNNNISNHVMFYGKNNALIEELSNIIAEMYQVEGVTEERFVTKFSCTSNQSSDRIIKSLNMTKTGNLLVEQAENLSMNECDEIRRAVEKNKKQVIMLSGNGNKFIMLFDKNRRILSRFSRCFFTEKMDSKKKCELFSFVSNQNDYELSEEARKVLEDYYSLEEEFEIESFFRFFDEVIKEQNNRMMEVIDVNPAKVSIIERIDIQRVLAI